jgi:CheY-like chemotaxis protein
MAWAQTTSAQPDLLIVDYRLPEQQTGVDAIKALRTRFGPDLPAIMVTGSTMSGHEADAAQYDLHLLVKPVVPTKLRAMGIEGLRAGMTARLKTLPSQHP